MTNQLGGHEMRELGNLIKQTIPGLGFAIVVFEFYKPGMSNYISNAQRADMITALKETVERLEKNQDTSTPERN